MRASTTIRARIMPATSRFPAVPFALAFLFGLLALCGLWFGIGQPVELADAATPTHKLQCASYTPFDKDQSPFDQPMQLRPERMEADLAMLAERFECLRTYSVTGLEELPNIARKHGLKLIAGAWVSRNPADTAVEIAGLVKLANAAVDSEKVAEKIADEARDDTPQALDAVWEEEQVKFFADQNCGESEIAAHQRRFAGAVAPQYLNISNGGRH